MDDRLGSTTNLTDKFGRVVGRADYNEWGEITYREALTITSSYRRIYPQSSYTGHDWDDVLGMYYAKARFYSAEDKRFVSMDPVKGQIIEPLSLVPYVYCVDNPLRWVDPQGNFAISLSIGAAILLEEAIKWSIVIAGGVIAGIATKMVVDEVNRQSSGLTGGIPGFTVPKSNLPNAYIFTVPRSNLPNAYIFTVPEVTTKTPTPEPIPAPDTSRGTDVGGIQVEEGYNNILTCEGQKDVGTTNSPNPVNQNGLADAKAGQKAVGRPRPINRDGLTDEEADAIDAILAGSTLIPKEEQTGARKGRTRILEKLDGDYDAAVRDFESIPLTDVHDIVPEPGKRGKTGTLSNGNNVTVREVSSAKRVTLQIPEGASRRIEIRYGPQQMIK